ncbi:10148_t:CDS:2, partial [Entrophospora sp. SA101]
ISVQSKPSKERRGGHNGRIPDFMLHNQDGTKTSIFTEITGPCKQNCKIKPYWDIYRAGIHVKDAIDSDIRKNKNLTPNETKKIIILINSFNLCSKGLPVNPLATRLISQRIGQDGITIPGPALLLDNYRKLTLDDLCFLLKEPFDIEEEKKAVKMMNDALKDLKSRGINHTIIM